jgi:hypothetical protein
MTFVTDAPEVATEEASPGCGCCIPPPDTAAKKLAELEARRQAVERRLRGLRDH